MRYMTPQTSGQVRCPACARSRMTQQPCCTAEPACTALSVMAFVEPQAWESGCIYTCGQALVHGTLFPALDKPFTGKGGCCNG